MENMLFQIKREIKYYIYFLYYIVHSILSRTEIASVVTIVGNLLCKIDVYESIGGWLNNPYDALTEAEITQH